MTKQIKADLDKVVEAVVNEMHIHAGEHTSMKLVEEDILTALDQFVVEEEIPSDILEYVDDIIVLQELIISGKHSLFDKYKKQLIDKINDIEFTTPTKGDSNEA